MRADYTLWKVRQCNKVRRLSHLVSRSLEVPIQKIFAGVLLCGGLGTTSVTVERNSAGTSNVSTSCYDA